MLTIRPCAGRLLCFALISFFFNGAGTRGHCFNVLLLALLCQTGPRGALTHRRRCCGIGSRQNRIVFDFGAQVSLRFDGPGPPARPRNEHPVRVRRDHAPFLPDSGKAVSSPATRIAFLIQHRRRPFLPRQREGLFLSNIEEGLFFCHGPTPFLFFLLRTWQRPALKKGIQDSR